MVQQNYEFREPTLWREQTVRSEDLSRELQGESGESQTVHTKDDGEAPADVWSIQGHQNEPRVQLYVPKEETFPIPLKCSGVTRSSRTDLDVWQEKRIDDNWNVDLNRSLSDLWKSSKSSPC